MVLPICNIMPRDVSENNMDIHFETIDPCLFAVRKSGVRGRSFGWL